MEIVQNVAKELYSIFCVHTDSHIRQHAITKLNGLKILECFQAIGQSLLLGLAPSSYTALNSFSLILCFLPCRNGKHILFCSHAKFRRAAHNHAFPFHDFIINSINCIALVQNIHN